MLPGSVAPWTKKSALDTKVQDDVTTVNVEEEEPGDFSLQIAVEMPYDIKTLHSPTHSNFLKIKVQFHCETYGLTSLFIAHIYIIIIGKGF